MHLLSATSGLSATGIFLAVSLVLENVAAIDPKFHELFKRQGCTDIESKCSTVGSDPSECIDYICKSCTQVDASISSCCQRSGDLNKAQCISDNLDTDSPSVGTSNSRPTAFTGSSRTGSAGSSSTTVFPADANRGCSSFLDKLTSCESATPGFEDIRVWKSQASCFCYSASAYSPQAFDNPYSSCLSYLETADRDLYSDLTVGRNFAISTPCASIGNVLQTNAGTATARSRTPAPVPTPTAGGNTRPTGSTETSSGASDSGQVAPSAASGHVGIPISIAIVTSLFALAVLL
ncbi:MAG: hypothetical protein L6R38_007071 [Xanthoria sp. 2 TBL-2021]|nr:MAG: hypothetical protein L6R38_007071 [Xanthoria sp. 2 TBL-2021]